MLNIVSSVRPPLVYEYICSMDSKILAVYFEYINWVFGKRYRVSLDKTTPVEEIVSDLFEVTVYENIGYEYTLLSSSLKDSKPMIRKLLDSARHVKFFASTDSDQDPMIAEFAKEFKQVNSFYQILHAIANNEEDAINHSLDVFCNMIRKEVTNLFDIMQKTLKDDTFEEIIFSARVSSSAGIVVELEARNV